MNQRGPRSPSAPGHGYQLWSSTNSTTWTPLTDWIRASGYTTGVTLPPTNGTVRCYRVEAAP